MGIEACPDCGNEVSDRADACPHCGYPLAKARIEAVRNAPSPPGMDWETERKRRRNRNFIIFGVIAVVLVVMVAAGYGDDLLEVLMP